MKALEGKAVVITGSSRGIGAAYAKAAAAEGASVVVNGTDARATERIVTEIRAAGGTAVGHVANVGSWHGAEGLVQRCVDEFGAIDGLINNAGVYAACKPDGLSESILRTIVEINLLGTAFCGAHAIRRMREQGSGSIVNTVSGAMMGLPFTSAYGASKGGVAALTYGWASDLGGSGVRVNAVSPMAWTRMAEETEAPEGFKGDWEAQKLAVAHLTPEQNAPLVIFLLSDGSKDVHGQVVRIQGSALSLIRRPEIGDTLYRETWTLPAIVEAFANDFHDRLQAVMPGDQMSLVGNDERS